METVTVKGKVYQIGQLYICNQGEIGILKKADESEDFPFILSWDNKVVSETKPCERIYELHHSLLGTITDAPIELENGDMCAFEYDNTHCLGFYSKANDTFVNNGEFVCFLNEAIMIDPLVSK